MLTKASFLLFKPGAFNGLLAAASLTSIGNGAAGIILYLGMIVFMISFVLVVVNVIHHRDFSHIGYVLVGGVMIGGVTAIVGAFMQLAGIAVQIAPVMPS